MTIDVLTHPTWQRLTLTLLHFVWQGAALAAVLAALFRLFPNAGAQGRYLFSLTVLALMMLCPAVTFALLGEPSGSVDAGAGRPAAAVAQAGPEASEAADAAAGRSAGGEQPDTSAEGALLRLVGRLQPHLLLLWLVGVAVLGVRLPLGWFGLLWIRGGRCRLPARLAAECAALGARLGVAAAGRVFTSERVAEALAAGFWRPIVLVPLSWVTALPTDMLRAVIAHELAHIRRRDLWANLFQRTVETLLFYHPAVWWVSGRAALEREMCCDEAAVAATGRPLVYAQALQRIAEWRAAAPSSAAVLAMSYTGGKRMNLLHRIRNVLGSYPQTPSGRFWPACLLASAVPLAVWAVSAEWSVSNVHADEKPAVDKKAGARDGEGGVKPGGGDGEGAKPRPRDGEGAKPGGRDGEAAKPRPRDGEGGAKPASRDGEAAGAPARPTGKEGRVFNTYDKNKDGVVTFDEWLSMKSGAAEDSARRTVEQERFNQADKDRNGKLTFEEFLKDRTKLPAGSKPPARDGEGGAKPGARDGEGGAKPGGRDGEGGAKPRGRDGEGGAKPAPRDGEGGRRAGGDPK